MTVRMMMLKRRTTRTITIAVFCVPGNMKCCSRPWRKATRTEKVRPNSGQKRPKIGPKLVEKGTKKESAFLGESGVGSGNDGVKAENRCWLGAAAASGGGHREEEEVEGEEEEAEEGERV